MFPHRCSLAGHCDRMFENSLLANPTCSESVTGEKKFQLLEDELKSYTSCNCFDFICSAAAQKRYGQISICY